MRTTLKASLTLLLGAALFTSCESCETATITPITEEDKTWLAYIQPLPADAKPDTIRFVNEKNEDFKFIRTQLHSTQIPGDGYSYDDKCIEQINTQASAVIQDITRKMPGLATYILRKPNELQVKLLVENLGTYEIQEQNPTYPSITIDGVVYEDVFEQDVPGNDTDNKGKVKKIYFNKEHGFIRVEFYGGKLLQLKH
ncbi:hypothetical protein [Pontibacter cellulosilyticus]|uniref:Lipoprotein n=1 Tax=Pontibacter cellulosilyticus TaxID=1720253 RepID=A0A923SJW7_9BACT|nr:hypothetical protein [Pontibacter cellulosilyticus]MBC5994329.1 hypothetical protein [Pontibacter cellulosilyticus]